ncbi:MAG: MerR family transcriptional regulator [Anaerolineae bacterium]|nr:MerR family transcriptional regulator [Anaerolineae bacterium]
MAVRYLRTSEVAQAVEVHPNTVRLYEEWGLLPPIPRTPSGYRQFTQAHLEQMRLARLAFEGPWHGRRIRKSIVAVVKQAASGDVAGARVMADEHLALVRSERAQAEAAADFLERWAQGAVEPVLIEPLQIRVVAQLLNVTTDMLRNWERNGLIKIPRDPNNGYRLYAAAEIGRLRVIRLLRSAGYSTMAILRMMLYFDQGQRDGLREALDTPRPDEDIVFAADRWLSTLAEAEEQAMNIIAQLDEMIKNY